MNQPVEAICHSTRLPLKLPDRVDVEVYDRYMSGTCWANIYLSTIPIAIGTQKHFMNILTNYI